MKFNNILNLLVKQKYIKKETGLLPGAILQMWSGAQIYQGIVNSFLLIATAYNTTLRESLQVYAPWLNFWLFFLLLLGGNLVMMLLHYKYIQPSMMAFNATQGYVHLNPAVTDLKDIIARLKRIEVLINEESTKSIKP